MKSSIRTVLAAALLAFPTAAGGQDASDTAPTPDAAGMSVVEAEDETTPFVPEAEAVREAQPTVAAQLRYAIPEPMAREAIKAPAEDNHGGIVGALERVARLIASGGGASHRSQDMLRAQARVTLEPVLLDDAEPWRVGIKAVTLAGERYDEQMPGQIRSALEQELRFLEQAAGQWSQPLTEAQALSLKLKGEAPVDLDPMLSKVRLWQGRSQAVTLVRSLKPKVIDVRFFAIGPGGKLTEVSEAIERQPMVAEVWISQPIDRERGPVKLFAGGVPLEIEAVRVGEDGRRFVTQPFYPVDPVGLPVDFSTDGRGAGEAQ